MTQLVYFRVNAHEGASYSKRLLVVVAGILFPDSALCIVTLSCFTEIILVIPNRPNIL